MIFVVGGKGLTGSAIVKYLKVKNKDYEIIQKQNKENFFGKECDMLIFANGNALKYSHYWDDKEVVLKAVTQNGMSLVYASDDLQNDKEVVLQAVAQNGKSLQFASEELQKSLNVQADMTEAIEVKQK